MNSENPESMCKNCAYARQRGNVNKYIQDKFMIILLLLHLPIFIVLNKQLYGLTCYYFNFLIIEIFLLSILLIVTSPMQIHQDDSDKNAKTCPDSIILNFNSLLKELLIIH